MRKDKPIIFAAESVRAILAGRKTQTRRVVKWKPREDGLNLEFSGLEAGCYSSNNPNSGYVLRSRGEGSCWNDRTWPAYPPHGGVGSKVWVKESWSHDAPDIETCRSAHEDAMGSSGSSTYGPYYRATEVSPDTLRWMTPLYMPRWASRITLEVTEVRVQRLTDISQDDARAEGVEFGTMQDAIVNGVLGRVAFFNARDAFAYRWQAINGKTAPWSTSPWVWCISFRRIP